MESKAIEQLLEKYLEGETSLQEETRLREYFTSGDVASHLQEYAPMFIYFGASRAEKYSGEMLREEQFDDGRKGSETQDKDKDPLLTEAPEGERTLARKLRKEVYSWVAVAASIVIMAGIFQEEQRVSEFGSYEDPEVAMEKTKEALDMVSQLMNSGKDDLEYLGEFNRTKNKITK